MVAYLLYMMTNASDEIENITIWPIYKCPNGASPQKETTRCDVYDVCHIWGTLQRLRIPNMYEERCIHNTTILMVVTMNKEEKYRSMYKENCKKPCYASTIMMWRRCLLTGAEYSATRYCIFNTTCIAQTAERKSVRGTAQADISKLPTNTTSI